MKPQQGEADPIPIESPRRHPKCDHAPSVETKLGELRFGRKIYWLPSPLSYAVRTPCSSPSAGGRQFAPEGPGGALAPADQAAFDALVVGQRMLSSLAPASLYHVDFVEAGRFEETEGAATYAGSYSYTNTGPDTGSVTFNYDDGDSCTYSVTFLSRTTGSLTYTCNDGTSGETNWRLVDDPDYAPVTPPETRTVEPESFSIPDLGGWSVTSNGTEADPRSGYGRIRAEAGSTTPSGIAMNDCSSAVAVFDGGPLPLFDLDMSRSVLHSPGMVLIRHETDGRRVTMFKGSGITTAPIAALVPVSLAVSARAQTAGSAYRLTVTIDSAPASCSTDDIFRTSRLEGSMASRSLCRNPRLIETPRDASR